MFAKDKACVPDHVNLLIKDSVNLCLVEAPQGIAELAASQDWAVSYYC